MSLGDDEEQIICKAEAPESHGALTDDRLVELTHALLVTADPNTVTPKQIRALLETQLCCDLSSKKDLIRTAIEEFFVKLAEAQAESSESESEHEVTVSKVKRKTGMSL